MKFVASIQMAFTMNPYRAEYHSPQRGSETFVDSASSTIILKTKLSGSMKLIKHRRIPGKISAFVQRIEYQKRCLAHAHILFLSDFDIQDLHAAEEVINVRYPEDSPFPEQEQMVSDFRQVIGSYQMNHHLKLYRLPDWKIDSVTLKKFHTRQEFVATTLILPVILRKRTLFLIIPCCLAHFRCRQCLQDIPSEECIGYALKCRSKSSDSGRISLNNAFYEGPFATRSEKLRQYPATRISSACECFAGICGYWRRHMKPTIQIFGIHSPGPENSLNVWSP
jgi:hypothetical protein